MKKAIATIGFLLLISCSVSGQEYSEPLDTDQLEVLMDSSLLSPSANNEMKRFDIGLTVGTGFSYAPGYYYGPTYYIAPGFSYLITPRFSLAAGIGLEHSDYYLLMAYKEGKDDILPMTRAFLYAHGAYLLTDRLTVGGTVYKGITHLPRFNESQPLFDYDYQGMGVNFHYKITRSFSVGLQMRVQQNSYYQNPGLTRPDQFDRIHGF